MTNLPPFTPDACRRKGPATRLAPSFIMAPPQSGPQSKDSGFNLRRITQRYSSYVFTGFFGVHILNNVIVPLTTWTQTSASGAALTIDSVFESSREFYRPAAGVEFGLIFIPRCMLDLAFFCALIDLKPFILKESWRGITRRCERIQPGICRTLISVQFPLLVSPISPPAATLLPFVSYFTFLWSVTCLGSSPWTHRSPSSLAPCKSIRGSIMRSIIPSCLQVSCILLVGGGDGSS